eukprot:TRINITY_DN1387_c0_g1_i2.p1 TRINITY_DN1387_c0_g1~~TRINITY_DN1387_c0_g1_i2.p1  ORF type:complete len:146 (-),score=31.74 TRINITY_DN1387_c0_g1_i2:31-468(-)
MGFQVKMENRLRPALFEKLKDIEPTRHYNLKVKIVKVESSVVIKRVDAEPIKMAVCLVGDDTGCAKLLLKDAQVELAKEGSFLILRNVHARIVKERIRLEVNIWGKVEKAADFGYKEINLTNKLSEVEYEAVKMQEQSYIRNHSI